MTIIILYITFNIRLQLKQLLRTICFFLLTIITYTSAWSQGPSASTSTKPARIMYLVDVSSSMVHDWQKNETRMDVVGRLINNLTDSLVYYNPNIEFGLRLIGSEYPAQKKVCNDTKLEVPFGTYNSVSIIKNKANYLKPYGFTPIAYALQQTATYDFVNSDKYNYSIILITDGGESCNGDICAIMQEMLSKKISFKPYILSLVKDKILEDQYACLGSYINILEQKDFGVAINKIIDENKVKLNIVRETPKTVDTPKATPQPIVKVDTPKATPQPVVKVDSPKVSVRPKIDTTIIVKQPKVDTPKITTIPKPDTPKVTIVPKLDTPKIEVPELKQEMRIAHRRNIQKYTIILVEGSEPRPAPMPLGDIDPFTIVITEPEKPVTTPKQPTVPKPKPDPITSRPQNNQVKDIPSPPKELEITNETTPSDKTQLRVRFVTRSGKEIFTEPQMKITNKATKVVKQERRLVTAGSKAITPITLDAGDYNIVIGNSSDYTKDVKLVPNQLNTVTIFINPSSLQFEYENNKSRPVKEYTALVSDRFSATRTNTKQPCDTKVFYEPGSYHVEVNTLPPTMYFLDLDFGVIKSISIPENGKLVVTNSSRIGRIELFQQLGDAYKFFYKMDILGNPANQTLELLPGNYQIRYIAPNSNEQKTVLFNIKSLKESSLEL